VYPLLEQTNPKIAQRGLEEILNAVRIIGLGSIRNAQYDPGATWYRALLELGRFQTSEDPMFPKQCGAALGGYLRRHSPFAEAVAYLDSELRGLDEDPNLRSTVQYELAYAHKQHGNIETAAMWLMASGRSAADAGDARKERMSRAEAVHWQAEVRFTKHWEAILGLRQEFEEQLANATTDEERDEAQRWIVNTHNWMAQGAIALGDMEALAEEITFLDQEQYIKLGWVPELQSLKDRLEEARRES
jgi:hypothetical protein